MNLKCAGFLMMLMAVAGTAPATGQDVSGAVLPPFRTIRVEGQSEVRAKPDTAMLDIAIETHAKSAEQCASLNAGLAEKVSDALKSKLDGKGKIETGGYSLYPEYREQAGVQKPEIIGYRAQNSVNVETSDLEIVGELIDTAIGAGANRINSLSFVLKNDTKARSEAIARASKDAQAQAEALAASMGVKLKRVYMATTVAEGRPMPVMMEAAAMARRVTTPVSPAEVTVPAHVVLVYEIE